MTPGQGNKTQGVRLSKPMLFHRVIQDSSLAQAPIKLRDDDPAGVLGVKIPQLVMCEGAVVSFPNKMLREVGWLVNKAGEDEHKYADNVINEDTVFPVDKIENSQNNKDNGLKSPQVGMQTRALPLLVKLVSTRGVLVHVTVSPNENGKSDDEQSPSLDSVS
uniref:Uncharacterized protein n=1 Tax=Timema bartmani TaxID=61472 RepID=A0A7R9EV75_9NEOP|nr:unnamed protein product [Timema bartmani]